jgi:hypothetical protein
MPQAPVLRNPQAPRDGHVIAAYIVSAEGTVVPGSVSILESTDFEFTKSACEVLHKQKYEPLMIEGPTK